jgi:glutaconate CoA-transferase subunit A
VVGSAHSIDVDLLIAAGVVSVCEESYVGFEQDLGLAPAFRRGAESGAVEVRESSCVVMLTQLRAAEMGVPFLPVRGLLGGDLSSLHPEWGTVTCPFTGQELAAVPALTPDVALLHAPFGDSSGNLHLDQPYVLDERFAHASRVVVATVDAIVSTEEVVAAGVTVPAHVVAAVVEAPYGAHPSSCYPGYAYDRPHLAEYVAAATAGPAAITAYLERYVQSGEDAYLSLVDPERLTTWSTSDEAWMELFR